MLDINLIREHPEVVRKAMKDRQMDASPVDAILQLDEKRRSRLEPKSRNLKAERNAVSKEISQLKDASAKKSKIEAMRLVGDKINALDKEVAEVESQLNALTATIPNIPDARTPYGKDDSENVVLRTIGEPKRIRLSTQAALGPWPRARHH